MIPAFLFSQDIVVKWIAAWMAPIEATYGMIEAELDRQKPKGSKPCEEALRIKRRRLQALPQSIDRSEIVVAAAKTDELDQASASEQGRIVSWLRRHLPRLR